MDAPGLFGAFASPTRLRILNVLQEQEEVCVCDLCEVLGEPQPKVSRHLAILRGTGLVEVRSDGKWKFYGLAQPRTPLHRALLRCVRSCLAELDELAGDREALATIERPSRCSPNGDATPRVSARRGAGSISSRASRSSPWRR
jgi:ArsR family transcriptional regulator